MKKVLGICAGIGTFWDGVTTFRGFNDLSNNVPIAFIFTLIMNGIILLAFYRHIDKKVMAILYIIVGFATIGDLYTAYSGNLALLNQMDGFVESDGKSFISVCMTVVCVGCTYLSSAIIFQLDPKEKVSEVK